MYSKVVLLVALVVGTCFLSCLGADRRQEHANRVALRRQQAMLSREDTWHRTLEEKTNYTTSLLARKPSNTRAVSPNDLAALKALYQATNGDKWNNNTGWMKGDPCQSIWFGVYCPGGRVLQITLVFNNLIGPIPAELAKADQLQVLRLYSNHIGGEIPSEIFSMSSLRILDLNNNELNGTLPKTINMASLTSLILYHNQLHGSITMTWGTPQLQVLEISSNTFTGPLPEGIGNLKDLQQLVVSRNSLTGSLPSSYGNLISLQHLWMFINRFDSPSLPSSWAGMRALQELQADGLVGAIPDWAGTSWTNMEILDLTSGKLTGKLPASICDLTKLNLLHLYENYITGELPSCMCNLRALTDLDVGDNMFTGSLPYCLGDITGLKIATFTRNNISGTLPESIGQLAKLEILNVCQNMLTGSIPASFDGLKTYELALCYNKFSEIDESLEDLFDFVKGYSCLLYTNPWSCPLPSFVPASCNAQCSICNSGAQHTYCSTCVEDVNCGWCVEGPNCLNGGAEGPFQNACSRQDWHFGSNSCP